jgi:hypothetical protein
MKKILSLLVCALISTVMFGQNVWTGAVSSDWNEAGNWSLSAVPTEFDKVVFNVPDAPECQLNSAARIGILVMGDGDLGGTLRIQNGGSLTTVQDHWSGIGWTHEATLIVEAGATATFASHLWNGWGGKGNLIIDGGAVNVTHMYGSDFEGVAGGSGEVQIKGGGQLNLAQIHPTQSISGESFINIVNGGILINGDNIDVINDYVTNSLILADDGNVDVIVEIQNINGVDYTAVYAEGLPMSISEELLAGVNVFPNPSNGLITIQHAFNGTKHITVYNMSGQVVNKLVNIESAQTTVDLSSASKGVYLVEIEIGSSSKIVKVVVR